jgi:hypothetical protein
MGTVRLRPVIALAVPIVALGLVLAAACDDTPEATACHAIPERGCPIVATVDACQDPSCGALYACNDGVWQLDHVCPARAADAGDAGDGYTTEASSVPTHAAIDGDAAATPGAAGGSGCNTLEAPDCPLALVLTCPANECCGCTDLFVCADGGWSSWGACADAGQLNR